jgi:TRAP-type C4-dicarboxylate transport system substrate-binding protein
MGASIEKDSNGTLKSKIFPSQQLGKAFDHYDMARDGIAGFTYVNPGYQPGRFPIICGRVAVPRLATPRVAIARSTPGIASMPPPR